MSLFFDRNTKAIWSEFMSKRRSGLRRCGAVRAADQLKSRLVKIMGATRVQMYTNKHTQLEEIFAHTAGHLLVMV